jgi:hypothetical protein
LTQASFINVLSPKTTDIVLSLKAVEMFVLSLKASNNVARRESSGQPLKDFPSLKATNKTTVIVARPQRAVGLFIPSPAMLAGL